MWIRWYNTYQIIGKIQGDSIQRAIKDYYITEDHSDKKCNIINTSVRAKKNLEE
jgi:hypothetical protein